MTEIHVATEWHMLPDGDARLLGAVDCVTGAMTRLQTARGRVLVDCGIAQGAEAHAWRLPDDAANVDSVVLTHAHLDHVGSLPALLEQGFAGPVFATGVTIDILRVVLDDSMRLAGASDAERGRVVARTMKLARRVPYDAPVTVADGIEANFREAGHILGSASVELCTKASRLIVSGDLGRPGAPVLRDPCTTWTPGPVDLVVMESTYGDRIHRHSHGDIERELERIVREAVARGGHILVPAFAIGRTQTLLYFLNELVESGRVRALPVAVDTPMGLKITETYAKGRALYDRETLERVARGDAPFDFDALYAVRRGDHSARLRDVPGPMLVIAGSGMCTGGRIVGHLKELLPSAKTTLMFVGHQASGTPGRRIQDAARRGDASVRIDGEDVPLRAHVETLRGLSAHADQRELLAWLRAIGDVRSVALHHGELDAQRGFAAYAATSATPG